MPLSFINYLTKVSSSGTGALTRSIAGEHSASGFIEPAPRHWAIEAYVPIDPRDLVRYLSERPEMTQRDANAFRNVADSIRRVISDRCVTLDRRFDLLYHNIDPDRDTRQVVGLENGSSDDTVGPAIDLCREILALAGYREVTRPELQACVGVASQWGVPLHVDFDIFKKLVVYCRGDVIGSRVRRRLRKFYKIEAVEVAVYQRMVVMFQLCDDITGDEELLARSLHLRMFKNIPKQDIDMLLPCTQVKFTWLDRLKIVVPSIGGVLLSARKIVNAILIIAVLTLKSTFVIAGLVFAAAGYVVRSVIGYFQTKNRYLLNLTRNLYFQKLDTNAGVGYAIIHQADEQAAAETVLAYFAILTADERLSDRKWQRRCERILREAIDLEVDVDIIRGSKRLSEMGLIDQDSDGRWKMTN